MTKSAIKDDVTQNPDPVKSLLTRLADTRNGFEKIVEEAEEDFEPVARAFRDLHAKHTDRVRRFLNDAGLDTDDEGSLMSKVNEAVIATRSALGTIDEDIMARVRSGEQHVLNAFDRAISEARSSELADELKDMRAELRTLIDRFRDLG